MRRFLFVLGPAALAAFTFACEDDPTGAPQVNIPDAGSFDANRDPSDSSTPDAPTDSPPSGPKGVTVIVTDKNGPRANIDVVFSDKDGAVLETKKTGTDGKATSTPTNATAMATAVLGGTNIKQVITWTGVEDGDELPAVAPLDGNIGVAEITNPGVADAGGGLASYYAKIGACTPTGGGGTDTGPFTIYVDPSCFRGAGAALVEARDTNDESIGFSFKKPITLLGDGGATPINGLPAYVAPIDLKVQATGSSNLLEGAYARVHEVANNTYFPSRENGYLGSAGGAGTTYEKTFKIPPATFTEAVNVAVSFETGIFSTRTIGKRAAPAATITFDANGLPPEITGASLDETNVKRPVAKWTGAVNTLRGGLVRISRFDSSADSSISWTIVVPATGSQVTLPAMPPALANLVPDSESGAGWDGPPEVIFADSNLLVGGYATFRKIQGAVLPAIDNDAVVEEAVIPANGDYKITHYKFLNAR